MIASHSNFKVYAFNAVSGQLLWSAATSSYVESSPAVANQVVYVGSYDFNVYAFNAATGQPIWSAATGNSVNSSPAVANGVVYVGSNDGNLYAFNAVSGQRLWSATIGSAYGSSPAAANGMVYVASYDGKLYAFGLPRSASALASQLAARPDPATLKPVTLFAKMVRLASLRLTGKQRWGFLRRRSRSVPTR
jgi:outer membrane protein assembly factor BamB